MTQVTPSGLSDGVKDRHPVLRSVKHAIDMIGLVADGDFSGAANAHTAYMLSSAVSISGNDWLADVSGFDKLLDILDEKGNQNGRLAGAASKEILMVMLPAALARPAGVVRNAPNQVRVASGFGQWAGEAPLNPQIAAFQQQLFDQGRVAFGRGQFTLAEIGNISSGLQAEVVITRIGQTRYMRLVGSHGGTFTLESGERLILHTHPGQGFWGLQSSAFGTDFAGLPQVLNRAEGLNRAAVVNESGWWRIYRRDGTLSPIHVGK